MAFVLRCHLEEFSSIETDYKMLRSQDPKEHLLTINSKDCQTFILKFSLTIQTYLAYKVAWSFIIILYQYMIIQASQDMHQTIPNVNSKWLVVIPSHRASLCRLQTTKRCMQRWYDSTDSRTSGTYN